MKVALTILSIIVILVVVGCLYYGTHPESNPKEYEGRFMVVETAFDYRIYVDTQTRVLYWSTGTHGVSPLLDSNGSVILYEGVLPR